VTRNTNLNPSQPSSSETPPSTIISYHPSAYSPPLNLLSTPNSIPGLEFVGFDHKTATHIFKTYDRYKEPFSSIEASNYDFFSFIHGHTIHINSSTFSGLSDAGKMTKLGIRQEIVDAILDERFRGVFGTQTLEYWIEETMKVRYASLLHLEREKDQEESDLDSEDLQHCTVVDHPSKVLDNHTILYKAMTSTSSLDHEPLFLDTGHLNISSLSSPRGGDFYGQNSAIYLTPQRQTAEMYRQYISLRCPLSCTFLLSFSIPDHLLSSLQTEKLYFSHTWKEFIWCCRTKTPLPSYLQYLGEEELVKGNICTKSAAQLAKLGLQDPQSGVTEADISVLDGEEKAVQWCFGEEKVREIIRSGGKVHVKVFGPLRIG
jgi:hypothetical protein